MIVMLVMVMGYSRTIPFTFNDGIEPVEHLIGMQGHNQDLRGVQLEKVGGSCSGGLGAQTLRDVNNFVVCK